MTKITHNLVQGSPEWKQYRLTMFGASEAAAMLGLSSKVSRTELLHMKHTCTPQEFSDWVQIYILDYGHEVEAMARPLALAPVSSLLVWKLARNLFAPIVYAAPRSTCSNLLFAPVGSACM